MSKNKNRIIGGLELLPPKAGVCQECASDHHPDEPHNQNSLFYQYKFFADHGRFPTWEDAMAHCDEEIKEITREVVSEEGRRIRKHELRGE